MRPGQVAVIVLVAAALGGLAALGAASLLGFGDGGGDTVVLTAPAGQDNSAPTDDSASQTSVKPLLGNGFDPAAIYRRRSPGVVTIYSIFDRAPTNTEEDEDHAAQGSGFVVSPQGYVLTSAHVISNTGKAAEQVYVAFRDSDRVDAEIVGFDLNDDVGVLKLDPADHALMPVPLGDSNKVTVGEPVAAIGSPFGNTDSLAVGVVSSTRRSIPSLTSRYNVVDAIQTDAPITHGNSGGPLLDARGRVIGINAQIRSESGDSEGVGFAIPINAARKSMTQLIEKGEVAYAYVGVTAGTLTPTLAERFDYPVDRGAVVEAIATGSPGLRAGLRCGRKTESFRGLEFKSGGDVIVAIDGRPVQSADDLVRIVSEQLEPGQQSTFEVIRNGERKAIAVRLGERPKTRTTNACS